MTKKEDNEYQKHIVSTPEHEVFLHRTSKDLADSIMKYGLNSGEDLLSTASHEGSDLDEAEKSYRTSHKQNNAVIVIKIPSDIYQKANEKMKREEVLHEEIGYFNIEEGMQGIYVHPKHVHGWIDTETNEYTPNPYHEEGFEHLKTKKFSDLEKEVLEQYKNKKPEKPKKKKKLTKEGLPPPPDEVNVPL